MSDKKVLKKNSFVEGTIVATISIFLVKLLGMLYVIPFYGMIDAKATALYAYAYNIYSIFLDISIAGIPIAMSKIIKEYDTLGKIEAKERAYRLGRNIIFIISLVVFFTLFIFAPQIGTLLLGDLEGGNTIQDVALAIRCVSTSILIVPFLSVAKGYLQGHNIIGVSSISQVLEQIVRIAVILGGTYLTIYVLGKSHSIAVCVAVTGAFFGALSALLYVIKKIRLHKKSIDVKKLEVDKDISNKEIIKKIFAYAIPFIIIDTMHSIYNFTDMAIVLRMMSDVGFSTSAVEFISSTISTWAPKISVVITTVAMGMTVSLIPSIVQAFTLKDYKEVDKKVNQALQMIIVISLPMAVGLALLAKPMWGIFYGISNEYGYSILAIVVFVSFVNNMMLVTNSTLQSLNKFKEAYIASILGFVVNIILDITFIQLFAKVGIPAYFGASAASIVAFMSSVLYALLVLKKKEGLHYGKTVKFAFKLLIPVGFMVLGVVGVNLLFKYFGIDYNNKLMSILNVGVSTVVGGLIYCGILIKTGTLKKVFGEAYYNKLLRKLTFGKLGNK
jgi:O-antigen/teichoic acid export membrane protein